MKIERRDDEREREILLAMIVNDTVCGRIASRWDGHLFAAPSANAVAGLFVDYHRKIGKAPRKATRSLFSTWAESKDGDSVALAESLLASLSDEYVSLKRETNPDYVLDVAGAYFNKVKLTRLKDDLESHLEAGNVKKAEEALAVFNKIQLGVGSGIDVFFDQAFVESVFAEDTKPILTYPGPLGELFGDALARDCFVSFTAPEKSCKSFILLDVAYRAMLQRRKVAFFEVGDMSPRQVGRRLMSRASGIPYRSTRPDRRWPCEVKIPTSIIRPESDEYATVEYEVVTFDRGLDAVSSWEACRDVIEKRVKSKNSYFRMSNHPNSSINVTGIRSILDEWNVGGWGFPDVLVLDYVDILAPPDGSSKKDLRDQIDMTWRQARALAQELHCLVVTATQADASSYDSRLINRRNFSNDKRKWSHISHGFGINMTAEDKKRGTLRINSVMGREGDSTWTRECHVATCLPLARPCVKSCF